MSEFRRALDEKHEAAKKAAPEGMELIGWTYSREDASHDSISPTVLLSPSSRPVYAFKNK